MGRLSSLFTGIGSTLAASPSLLVGSLAAAFSFLTRLPIPGRPIAGAQLGRSVVWFPLVGAALGAVLLGTAHLLGGRLPAGVVAVLLVALLAIMTGGLHLDGLADTFDALGGGRGDRTRMLEIMHDSRIGAHGAAALFLVLAAKIFALVDLTGRGTLWPILAAPIFARWAVVPLIVFFRYARPHGLGSPFHEHARPVHVALAAAVPAAMLLWAGTAAIVPATAALVAALACGAALDRRLDGLTGDVYGAAIELGELAFLIASTR